MATAGGQAGEPVLQVANAGGRAGDPVGRWPPGRGGGTWCPGSSTNSGPKVAAGGWVIRCPRWPAAAGGGGGDLVRGGPRAAAGSGPRVATAGGPAGEPVLQVAPGPPTSPGLRVATAGDQAGEPVLQVANAGGRAGDPVLRVAPRAGAGIRCPGSSTNSGPKVASGGRRRGAEGPGWWWGFVGVHAEYGIPGRRRARRPGR